jgi:DNA gyrase subunit A
MFTLPPKNSRAAGWYLVTASKGGMVKKSAIEELPSPSAQTFQVMNIKEGDSLGWACLSDGKSGIWMATMHAMAIHFAEDTVRATGMTAAGVNGIKLKGEDLLISMQVVDKESQPLMLASDGKAKRVRISQFPVQGRYGQGVAAWKLAEGVTLVGAGTGKPNHKVIVHLARAAAKAFRFDAAPIRTRPTKGKALLEIKETDRIVKLTIPWEAPNGVFNKTKPKKKSTPNKTNNVKPSAKKTSPAPKAEKKTTPPKKKSAKPKTKRKSAKKKKGGGTKPKQSKMDI